MKLRDYGESYTREFFQQILQWSRKKISFEDNVDCQILTTYIDTAETKVPHNLGRVPQIIIPVAKFPYGTSTIAFSRENSENTLFLTRGVAGYQTLILL